MDVMCVLESLHDSNFVLDLLDDMIVCRWMAYELYLLPSIYVSCCHLFDFMDIGIRPPTKNS
jgi:hypothetical protein